MPPVLRAVAFTNSMQELMSTFTCGDSAPARDMNDFIQSARWCEGVEKYGNEVFVFKNSDDVIVGFASLGKTKWPFPTPADPRQLFSYIRAFAIRREFQGCPHDVPVEERYATLILDALCERAKQLHRTEKIVLHVTADNQKAIERYESYGFASLPCEEGKLMQMFIDL